MPALLGTEGRPKSGYREAVQMSGGHTNAASRTLGFGILIAASTLRRPPASQNELAAPLRCRSQLGPNGWCREVENAAEALQVSQTYAAVDVGDRCPNI